MNPHEVELREQYRWLPIANVARLMKNTLPGKAKVSKDAKECMQECVSEFISFITSEASDKCVREKRKTINGEDILYSMHDLGFENYAEVLKIYLAKYREQQAIKQERGETRASKRHAKMKLPDALGTDADSTPIVSEDVDSEDGSASSGSEQDYDEQHDEVGGHSEHFFPPYGGSPDGVAEGPKPDGSPKQGKGYGYDDFMTDPSGSLIDTGSAHSHSHGVGVEHENVDELAKHLTADGVEIDTLAAGISNGNSNLNYF